MHLICEVIIKSKKRSKSFVLLAVELTMPPTFWETLQQGLSTQRKKIKDSFIYCLQSHWSKVLHLSCVYDKCLSSNQGMRRGVVKMWWAKMFMACTILIASFTAELMPGMTKPEVSNKGVQHSLFVVFRKALSSFHKEPSTTGSEPSYPSLLLFVFPEWNPILRWPQSQ